MIFQIYNHPHPRLNLDHKSWSQKLSKSQNELAIDLTDSQIALANETLNPLIDEAHTAMSQAYNLLRKANTSKMQIVV